VKRDRPGCGPQGPRQRSEMEATQNRLPKEQRLIAKCTRKGESVVGMPCVPSLMIAQGPIRTILRTVVSRFIATALLLILAGDTALPVLLANPESALPACCRRDGKHHCAMMESFEKQEQNAGPSFRTAAGKCPLFPKGTVAYFPGQSTPPPAAAFVGSISSHPVFKAQTEILYRISHGRTRQKRGPPSFV
jgi:hypothetical protein